jgi:hypothetical protein
MQKRAVIVGGSIVDLKAIQAIGPAEHCLPDCSGKWAGERTFLSPGFKIYLTNNVVIVTFPTIEEALEARSWLASETWIWIEEAKYELDEQVKTPRQRLLDVVEDELVTDHPGRNRIIREIIRVFDSIGK